MADSLFSSLLGSLDKQNIGEIASSLAEPDQLVSHGLRSSIAAIMASIASRAEDHSMLRSILNLAPSTPDVSWSQSATAITDPNSALMAGGRRALSALFGNSESAVTSAVSRDSGLRFGITSKLLSMTAPVILGFLARRVRDSGLSMSGLSDLLKQESGTIRNALPPGLSEMFWPRTTTAGTTPVVARTMEEPKPTHRWAAALAIAAAALGLFWLINHARRPSNEAMNAPMGEASREAMPPRAEVPLTLPDHVKIRVPQGGPESRMLADLQNPSRPVNQNDWYQLDRVKFRAGTASLTPDSEDQLKDIAAIMAAYPNAHVKIGGFTDNMGDAAANQKTSQAQADAVKNELMHLGVSQDRMQTVGYGAQFPVADNSTAQGREQNRRVSILVTQR